MCSGLPHLSQEILAFAVMALLPMSESGPPLSVNLARALNIWQGLGLNLVFGRRSTRW
jgi:hypothetical protein